jgi:two-component system phosphate regulon sensor histidine kinase PhoR
MQHFFRDRRFLPLAILLVGTLLGLLVLLYSWAQESVRLREELFLDRLNKELDIALEKYENTYYCFEFEANTYFNSPDSFALVNPYGQDSLSGKTNIAITHQSEGKKRNYSQIPVYSAGRINLKILMEFDMIPSVKPDSTLTGAEQFIRSYYHNCITSKQGERLIDTVRIDTAIRTCVHKINSNAQVEYWVNQKSTNKSIYQNLLSQESSTTESDLEYSLYQHDDKIADLAVFVRIPNKSSLFSASIGDLYLSSGVLVSLAMLLILYMGWMYVQQKRLMAMQEDFVHSMTHEFNTPISSIKLIAQRLKKSTENDLQKASSILEQESKKLQTGINLVLTTTLMEKDEVLLQKEFLEFNEFVGKIAVHNELRLQIAKIKLNTKLSSTPCLVYADVFHLENVIQNLINNCIKHSNASELLIQVTPAESSVLLSVADNGIGVEAHRRNNIFKKFGGRAGRSSYSGFGLGLYYAKLMIQLFGGKIRLDEGHEPGMCIEIELPYGK